MFVAACSRRMCLPFFFFTAKCAKKREGIKELGTQAITMKIESLTFDFHGNLFIAAFALSGATASFAGVSSAVEAPWMNTLI